MAYRRAGNGPPVLLLHGIPGSSASWLAVGERLASVADVIVPDLLGFGASVRPSGLDALHARAQAEAVADLLDDLAVGPVTVIGHDFGGPVALMLHRTDSRRVRALGLLATNTFTDTPIPFPLSTVTWPGIGSLAARALFSAPSLRMMMRQGVGAGGERPDARSAVGDRAQQRTIATIFAGSLRNLAALYAPVEAELRTVSVPGFVAWGDCDPFFPLAQGERTATAARVPLHVYEGAGHFLPDERPDAVARDVAALVARVTA